MILIVSAILCIYFVDDYMVSTNDDYKQEFKREIKKLNNDYKKIATDLRFQKQKFSEQIQVLKSLKSQKVYEPKPSNK